MGSFFSDASIDRQPTAHITAKMRSRGARNENGTPTNAVATSQSASDHAQRTEAWLCQLEDGWGCGIDVAIYEAHLGADVTSRVTGQARDAMRSIVPAQSGQTDTARISSHQKGCVRRSGYRGKRRCNGRQASFGAQCSEGGQLSAIDEASENIRPRPICYDHYYLRIVTWRALCRRTQL